MISVVDVKGFQMFWTFKIRFDVVILVFFGLAIVLASFSKNWAIFVLSSGACIIKVL